MKKTLLFITFAAIISIFAVSCSPKDSSDPKTVLVAFAERLAKKDFDGAAALATSDSRSTIDMVKMGMEMAEKMNAPLPENDPVAQLNNAEFSEAKIEGDKAVVTLTNKTNKQQPPIDFTLLKESGEWKVDFSMAALTNMGRNQIQQQGGDAQAAMDSITKNLDPEQLEKAKKMADSVLKNIDPKQLEEIQKQVEKFRQQ